MKNFYKFLALGVLAIGGASCADEIVESYPVEKPESVEAIEALNAYKPLKDYVDKAKYPNLKLGVGVAKSLTGSDFLIASTNFDEVVPRTTFMTGASVAADGSFDFDDVAAFVDAAKSAGLSIHGNSLCASDNQSLAYLNKQVENKPDPTAKVENMLRLTQTTAKENPWNTQVQVSWEEPLDNSKKYTLEFRSRFKGAKCPSELHISLISNENDNNIPRYGVKVGNDDWNVVQFEFDPLKKGDYQAMSIGYGQTEGDLDIDDIYLYPSGGDKENDNVIANSTFDELDKSNWNGGERYEEAPFTEVFFYKEHPEGPQNVINLNIPKNATSHFTQLWVVGSEGNPVAKGDKIKVSMWVKGDHNYSFGGGFHGYPDGSAWKAGSSLSVKVTDYWSYFEQEMEVTADVAGIYSIAFDLCEASADRVLSIANLSVKQNGTEWMNNGSFKSDDFTKFMWKPDNELDLDHSVIASCVESVPNLVWKEVAGSEKEGGIPQTMDEKREKLIPFMTKWIEGVMKAANGYVTSWDVVSNPLAPVPGNPVVEEHAYISGVELPLFSRKNEASDKANSFYWVDHLGKNYGRDVLAIARQKAASTAISNPKFYISECGLEDPTKLTSFINLINYWEADGTTKFDGIGTNLIFNCVDDASKMDEIKKNVEDMLKALQKTGKLVRISGLELGYANATGRIVKAKNITAAQQKNQADMYTFIIKKYLEIIPADQQGGICKNTPADQSTESKYRPDEAIGIWSEGYNRKQSYAGFADGLQ